jgi:hypothetical protein
MPKTRSGFTAVGNFKVAVKNFGQVFFFNSLSGIYNMNSTALFLQDAFISKAPASDEYFVDRPENYSIPRLFFPVHH